MVELSCLGIGRDSRVEQRKLVWVIAIRLRVRVPPLRPDADMAQG